VVLSLLSVRAYFQEGAVLGGNRVQWPVAQVLPDAFHSFLKAPKAASGSGT
jgi:hypothetical protein